MREFTLILLLSFGYCSAWICGNTGQCSCTSSGTVLCKDVSEAPFFTTDNRAGLKLTITTREADFDLTSLSDTVGFEKVMIDGLSTDLCSQTLVLFPWVRCLVSTRDTPRQTLRSEVTDAVTAATEEPYRLKDCPPKLRNEHDCLDCYQKYCWWNIDVLYTGEFGEPLCSYKQSRQGLGSTAVCNCVLSEMHGIASPAYTSHS